MAECLKLSYRVKIEICNWGWTKIAKWKSRTWSSDTYGPLQTRWWNVMVQKGLELDQSHVCWIYDVPLYSVSGKWHVLKYVVVGFRKSVKRSQNDLKLQIRKMQHVNLIPILLSWRKLFFLKKDYLPWRENFLEGFFRKKLNIYYSPNISIVE